MKTQDFTDEQVPPSKVVRPRRMARLASIGGILVVLCLVGVSAVVYAQLGQHKSQASISPPPSGTWAQVLQGYTLTSLRAADSDVSVLYACATTSPSGQATDNVGNNTSYTVLRSTDFGTHWQDVGGKANLGSSCELAINPTDSNDLYAVGIPNAGQAVRVLEHSTDGGQTWSTIQPTINLPDTKSAPVWNADQLSMAGKTLFGVQWMLPSASSTGPTGRQGPLPKSYARLTRLVRSSDGGHSWTVVDAQFTSSRQGVSSYAVDPSNANTMYEMVRMPLLPILPATRSEPDVVYPYGNNGELYKTTDGGATWQLLLKNLPFGTQFQLARSNAQILYVGGSSQPLPYLVGAPVRDYPNSEILGTFHLQMSSDGGATWHDVPKLPQSQSQAVFVQEWFIDPNGQVYLYSSSVGRFGGQPTAVVGTAVPATPDNVPQSSLQPLVPVTKSGASIPYRSDLTPPPSVVSTSPVPIQRYDPASNTWHEVTKPPTYGELLTVTSSGGVSSDVLWFMGTNNGQPALYRYVEHPIGIK